jgi:hypothetical protein
VVGFGIMFGITLAEVVTLSVIAVVVIKWGGLVRWLRRG